MRWLTRHECQPQQPVPKQIIISYSFSLRSPTESEPSNTKPPHMVTPPRNATQPGGQETCSQTQLGPPGSDTPPYSAQSQKKKQFRKAAPRTPFHMNPCVPAQSPCSSPRFYAKGRMGWGERNHAGHQAASWMPSQVKFSLPLVTSRTVMPVMFSTVISTSSSVMAWPAAFCPSKTSYRL